MSVAGLGNENQSWGTPPSIESLVRNSSWLPQLPWLISAGYLQVLDLTMLPLTALLTGLLQVSLHDAFECPVCCFAAHLLRLPADHHHSLTFICFILNNPTHS